MSIKKFFKHFDDPKYAQQDIKIKDFPANMKFSDAIPSLYQDFMNMLPLPEYMSNQGTLNLVSHLPVHSHIRPDLGPKMYDAFVGPDAANTGTTQLHLDAADAINILQYSAGGTEAAAAIWHIFRRQDADGIRSFIQARSSNQSGDPIHNQNFYLTDALLVELAGMGIKPFIMEQKVGETVLIPAGCAHQVRNLYPCIKLAMDFVAPESAATCSMLSSQFRLLPRSHRRNVDILNVPTLLTQAWDACRVVQGEPPVFQEADIIIPQPMSKRSWDSSDVAPASSQNLPPSKRFQPATLGHQEVHQVADLSAPALPKKRARDLDSCQPTTHQNQTSTKRPRAGPSGTGQ